MNHALVTTEALVSGTDYKYSLEALRKIWQEILNESDIADSDNFFDRGGDSLAALRVWRRAVAEGFDMPRAAVILCPVLHELAAAVVDPTRFEQ